MLEWINRYVFGAAVPLCLLGVGLYFLVTLRFFPFTRSRAVLGYFAKREKGEGTSPLRALCLALAGTLGVGNIVGVSSAIYLGGFGAVFWMCLSALAAMILKYAEIVLAMRHRRRRETGGYGGGAPYYISDILAARGLPKMGRGMAAVFAVLCIADAIFMGCVIQVNAVSSSLAGVLSVPPLLSGAVLAVLCLLLFSQKEGSVGAVTERLVPFMSVAYVVLSLWCIFVRRGDLGWAIGRIFEDAFRPQSAAGGVLGFLFSRALRFGSMRGLVSNEAGCGTSPIAHASSNAKSPVEQGFFGLVEVFVDTILLCSMTALVVVLNYDAASAFGENPMMMTIRAYSAPFSGGTAVAVEAFLAVAVLLFGFATLICWGHYGVQSLAYLTENRGVRGAFVLVYSLFAVFGAVSAPASVWTAADLAIGAMTVINVAVLFLGRREVRRETFVYFGFGKKRAKKQKK